ncbi:hypothetical protein BH10PSE9_BH10PSE9_07890 [soil metagenome]
MNLIRIGLLFLVLLLGAKTETGLAQFAPCGSGAPGFSTCTDGVTIVAGAGQSSGGTSIPGMLPRCSAGSVSAGPCVCSDGRVSGLGGTCAEHACPAGQIRVGDNCRCVQRGFVPEAASGVCGCPAGTVMAAGKGGPTCVRG